MSERYNYNREELLQKVKANPSLKLNSGQLMLLIPHLTRNFIKHRCSPRCKYPMPHSREGNKPFFILNQVDAYLKNPQTSNSANVDENTEVKKVKRLKSVK